MKRIAIIGTGITGLSLANSLTNASITFFDKSRKAGGRITTRSTRQFPNLSFDHGLHYLHSDAKENV
jgi:predicted NAD/FAD-dependent oxidoreductase